MTRYEEVRHVVADCVFGYKNIKKYAKKIVDILTEEREEVKEVFNLKDEVRDLKWHELALMDEMINGADKGSAYVDESFFNWAWKYLPVEIVEHPVKGGDMMFRYDYHRKQWQFIWDYTA